MKAWWIDGIVWLAIGVSLVAQAGFLLGMSWLAGDAAARDAIPPTVASAVVAGAFLVLGVGALGLGVRRISAPSRATHRVGDKSESGA